MLNFPFALDYTTAIFFFFLEQKAFPFATKSCKLGKLMQVQLHYIENWYIKNWCTFEF